MVTSVVARLWASSAKRGYVIGETGIAIIWGLVVMVMVYTIGHITFAHFNPAVTMGFISCERFPVEHLST
ncbi:putative major intrinsic protein [Helianthus annuus]|nr:putative major intrinsic protein [Helianthus annuus]